MRAASLLSLFTIIGLAGLPAILKAEIEVTVDRNDADRGFRFDHVAPPASNDAATGAVFEIFGGARDGNGAELGALHDGAVPTTEDQPAANFFFGGDGGRVAIDLGRPLSIARIGSYSWHGEGRGPQVYKVYGASGDAAGLKLEGDADPATVGWKLLASVDTRSDGAGPGGQYGVAITDPKGALGKYRYLLFDIAKTSDSDPFSNTFLSEIDVVDASGPKLEPVKVPEKVIRKFTSGRYTYLVDATAAPDLLPWAEESLMPVVKEWYPKVVAMLPSPGYREFDTVNLEFRSDMGGTPAYAAGNRVALSIPFFRNEQAGQGRGAVVHELVHVAQDYWRNRRTKRERKPTPSWVTEGIADQIRWFIYEPESRGAEITEGNYKDARHDSSYRVTANFFDWVIRTYDRDLIRKLNAAAREGEYSDEFWEKLTGKPLAELDAEWRRQNAKRLGIPFED